MTQCSRGGLTLKSGKIGRCNVLRQQIMMPGERMNMSIEGSVRLETLRERDVFRINAHLATFMTPLRWLVSDWPTYVKTNGVSGTIPSLGAAPNLAKYGIGAYNSAIISSGCYQFWEDAPLRIYNEWYKWPENADSTSWNDDGEIAVPLSKNWSRARFDIDPSVSNDYTQQSLGDSFDIRELAVTQARFRSAMKRETLSFNRWMELVKQTWKGDGSREVDQVPIMLDQVEVGVNPRDMPATDGASLGQWQSIYDFGVDHQIRGIVAPEHCIITTILVVRFGSITEAKHPLAEVADPFVMTADPEYLGSAQPELVQLSDVFMSDSSTDVGYLPAGWQWRSDHDVIGELVDTADSFPYMDAPTTQAECKDATRTKDAFRSTRLGDYLVDVYFKEDCNQPIGTAMDSYMSGMVDHTRNMGNSNDEFPHGGKQL
jgi:hypothetical protein